jgi:hypothetical protein
MSDPTRIVPTVYYVLGVDGTREAKRIAFPQWPGYLFIKKLVEPLINGPLEHVTVLYERRRADMFVHEHGHKLTPPLPRNDAATAIYRTNWLTQHPGADPESLPFIAGVAVLFDRIIWN